MITQSLKNDRLKNILQFSRWLMVFLLILELVIRLFVFRLPYQQYVSYLGYVPVDNSTAIWGVEGFGVTHYLSNGEVATPYQTGASVVVLGDSFTEALQVSNKEKYVSVAETILHERDIRTNLHNLGGPGRNIADYVYIAPVIKQLYSPKIVVIQITASDFEESLDSSRPNYFVHDGSSLKFEHNDDYFTFNLGIQNILRSSGIGSLLVYKLTPSVKKLRQKLAAKPQDIGRKLSPAEDNKEVPFSQATEAQDAKNQFSMENDRQARDIEVSIAILRESYPDSHMVFLVIPSVPLLQNDYIKWDNEVDDNIVAKIRNLSGLDVIYPKDGFLSLYAFDQKLPRGFFNGLPNAGHLNVDGNYAVGVALADYIERVTK